MSHAPIIAYIDRHKLDAVEWQLNTWMNDAGDNSFKKGMAQIQCAEFLAKIENGAVREEYIKYFTKRWKVKPKDFSTTVSNKRSEQFFDEDTKPNDKVPLPDWVTTEQEKEINVYGWATCTDKGNVGVYFEAESGHMVQQLKFSVTALYHIYNQRPELNRRIVEVANGYTTSIVEIPSKGMLSPEQFCAACYAEGNYLPTPSFSKNHWLKMLSKMSQEFTTTYEMDQLGWQPEEGFFAFSNKAYLPPEKDGEEGKLAGYNTYGVVEIGKRHFLSPSVSTANSLVRSADNIYENDLYLAYKKSPIDFSEWCGLMVTAYDKNGWMAIPFVIATIFRDAALKVTKIPHLYGYGPAGSGKSEWAESIFYLFFSGKNNQGFLYKPFNLNQGTEYSFWNALERFQNCPFVGNEFDENSIEDIRFRAMKAAYDGEGRTKGMKDRNRSTMQKVVSTIILIGQFLGTKDDNSVLTRSIPLPFKLHTNRPPEMVDAYQKLKAYEAEGLSGILIELLEMRHWYENQINDAFAAARKILLEELRAKGVAPPDRILKNVALMLANVDIVSRRLNHKLPFTTAEFKDLCVKTITDMTNLISSTSGISEFWSMVEFLLDRGVISENVDFIISTERNVKLLDKETGNETDMEFLTPKPLLFLRLGNVHKLYQEETRKKSGKAGMNESSLLMYMKEQPYFLGSMKQKKFDKKNTSCYVLDYEKLNCNLVREKQSETVPIEIEHALITSSPLNSGVGVYSFNISVEKKVPQEGGGFTVEQVWYKCFTEDPEAMSRVVSKYKIALKGTLEEIPMTNGKWQRNINVASFETTPTYNAFPSTVPDNQELPGFGNTQGGGIDFSKNIGENKEDLPF